MPKSKLKGSSCLIVIGTEGKRRLRADEGVRGPNTLGSVTIACFRVLWIWPRRRT
jgi:hypothetical protein